ncbi:MAG: YihY family inner membrane protein, partial [Alphaproteobacteria bacterium]|nr:YihY family inner membrane protein [Alphaproteobacteria bacterium]
LIPMLAITLVMLTSFKVFTKFRENFTSFIIEHLVPDTSHIIVEKINDFLLNIQHLTVVGIAFLIISLVFVFSTIESAFNDIWWVRKPRAIVKRVLAFWTTITLGPLLVAIALQFSEQLFSQLSAYGINPNTFIFDFIEILFPIICVTGFFTLIYFIIPHFPVRLKHAFIGGIFSTLMFSVLRYIFTAYTVQFSTYKFIYGTLSFFPFFIMWMYTFWLIVLIGAIITACLPEWHNVKNIAKTELEKRQTKFLYALNLLFILFKDSQTGGQGVEYQALINQTGIGGMELENLLNELQEASYTERTEKGSWILSHDPGNASLYDIYRIVGGGIVERETNGTSFPWVQHYKKISKSIGISEKKNLNLDLKSFFLGKDSLEV